MLQSNCSNQKPLEYKEDKKVDAGVKNLVPLCTTGRDVSHATIIDEFRPIILPIYLDIPTILVDEKYVSHWSNFVYLCK